ncbi:hypothetical protein ACO2Q1_13275 [Brevundimonas sp. VNH65]
MTRDEIEALILALPEVERAVTHGEPSFKAAGGAAKAVEGASTYRG